MKTPRNVLPPSPPTSPRNIFTYPPDPDGNRGFEKPTRPHSIASNRNAVSNSPLPHHLPLRSSVSGTRVVCKDRVPKDSQEKHERITQRIYPWYALGQCVQGRIFALLVVMQVDNVLDVVANYLFGVADLFLPGIPLHSFISCTLFYFKTDHGRH